MKYYVMLGYSAENVRSVTAYCAYIMHCVTALASCVCIVHGVTVYHDVTVLAYCAYNVYIA